MKITSLIIFLSTSYLLYAQVQKKEDDSDIIYNEDKVPHYDLPKQQWIDVRRPQILGLFSNLVYGVVPQPSAEVLW